MSTPMVLVITADAEVIPASQVAQQASSSSSDTEKGDDK